ncbi:MAG TPA: EF-P beta-lysylation protein EpmB [Thermoanaerobaculia bacterium]|nr:EF-P beta-lysylation protein EpmB [Thermoanaerobaculia bacterium]
MIAAAPPGSSRRSGVPWATGSWRAALRAAIRDPGELARRLGLEPSSLQLDGAPAFPLLVPLGLIARMRRGDPRDPLLLQVLPALAERCETPGFVADPLAEAGATLAPGLLHKYRGRALLVATGACAVHCRYCFRRHYPYAERGLAAGVESALEAIGRDRSIHEVILSGGDPLTLSDRALEGLTRRLESIPHVRRLRVHTRLPIALPERVDAGLLGWLEGLRLPVVMVVHANHPAEIDERVAEALALLRAPAAALLNQSVLLRGVNDDAAVLAGLSERLFACGVLPYYLHLLDPVAGAAHFDLPADRARALHASLRERLPGYLVPRLVREIPGEPAKSPVEALKP